LTLTLPPGLSPDAVLPAGCSIAGSMISCAVPNLGVDESYTFEFASQVITAEASVITLAATVSGGTPLDGVSQNNDDVADISVLPGT
ncbi:hypothetical protein, partial [Escherichia coli]|uniref:hypothetical protein n=1 Tax=Escherichia coli TaxID=562 RepID=UPI0022F0F409